MKKATIQHYLQENNLAGWLLYDFRGLNPIALQVTGLKTGGSRRWFLWVPAQGDPVWLIHAIETNAFVNVPAELTGEKRTYVGWRDLAVKLPQIVGAPGSRQRIVMEYSPAGAIPYTSYLDAGMKEFIEQCTGAEIVSSADLVQQAQAVLTSEQMASHRRAVVHCMALKDAAFGLIRQRLQQGQPVTEYDVQQFIMEGYAAVDLDPDHPPIVSVNANAAMPHYAPTAERHQPIRAGDMVLIDLWARERNTSLDCFADLTWTGYCGAVVPPKVQAVFNVVAKTRDTAVAFIQKRLDAGQAVYGYEVDDACRQVIINAGYGDYIIHRTGHSLGPAVHFNGVNLDNTEIQDRRQLIPGVMFTVEPGLYQPNLNFDDSPVAKGLGIRSEINCFMHADRVEVTTLPLQTAVIPLLA